MGYDVMTTAAVVKELSSLLTGRVLFEIRTVSGPGLILLFGPRRNPAWLVLATGELPCAYGMPGPPPESLSRIFALSDDLSPPPFEAFGRLLEARLAGRPLAAVGLFTWERSFELAFDPREGLRGDGSRAFLIHEAAPKPARLLLLGADQKIVAAWPAARSPGRRGPGEPYQPPPRPRGEELPPSDLVGKPEVFLRQFETSRGLHAMAPALGRSLSNEIERRAAAASPPGETLADAMHEAFASIVELYPDGPFDPGLTVTVAPPNLPVDVTVVTTDPGPGRVVLSCDRAGQALLAWHQAASLERMRRAHHADLRKTVRAAADRARRKLDRRSQDLTSAGDPDEFRLAGELLLTNLAALRQGQSMAALVGFDGRPVEIGLDPRLSPSRNAERYFARYRKAKRAARRTEFVETTARELDWLAAIGHDLDRLEPGPEESGPIGDRSPPPRQTPPQTGWSGVALAVEAVREAVMELVDLRRALEDAGYRVGRSSAGESSRRARPRPGARLPSDSPRVIPPLRFVSSDGLVLLAGRSARQNETLSLKTAGPDDLWFHVRGRPGPHVIMRLPPGSSATAPERSVLEAAALAVHLSSVRAGGKIAVDYTRARHLRRPRGVPPGLVLYDHHETVLIDTGSAPLPTPAREEEEVED